MQRKNGIKLYDGGLIALLVFVCVLAVVVVGQRAKEVRRKYEERLAREKRAIPYYNDEELIAKYYRTKAELQGALDDLGGARNEAMGEEIRETSRDYGGGFAGGFAEGFSRAFRAGAIKERLIKMKVETLRQMRALYLTEIARRGLKLP